MLKKIITTIKNIKEVATDRLYDEFLKPFDAIFSALAGALASGVVGAVTVAATLGMAGEKTYENVMKTTFDAVANGSLKPKKPEYSRFEKTVGNGIGIAITGLICLLLIIAIPFVIIAEKIADIRYKIKKKRRQH